MGTGQTGGVMGGAFTWGMACLHVGTPAASGMSRIRPTVRSHLYLGSNRVEKFLRRHQQGCG